MNSAANYRCRSRNAAWLPSGHIANGVCVPDKRVPLSGVLRRAEAAQLEWLRGFVCWLVKCQQIRKRRSATTNNDRLIHPNPDLQLGIFLSHKYIRDESKIGIDLEHGLHMGYGRRHGGGYADSYEFTCQ